MITQNTGFSKWGFGILHIKKEKNKIITQQDAILKKMTTKMSMDETGNSNYN